LPIIIILWLAAPQSQRIICWNSSGILIVFRRRLRYRARIRLQLLTLSMLNSSWDTFFGNAIKYVWLKLGTYWTYDTSVVADTSSISSFISATAWCAKIISLLPLWLCWGSLLLELSAFLVVNLDRHLLFW